MCDGNANLTFQHVGLGLPERNGCIVVSESSHCVILIVQTARGW